MANTKKKDILEKAEEFVESAVKEVAKEIKSVAKKVSKAVSEVAEIESDKLSKHSSKKPKESAESSDKKAKIAKLLEKAKLLEGSVKDEGSVDLKKKLKSEDEEKVDTLVPMEDYLKSSIHLGTRVITPDMRRFVYRRRADGLAVFNTSLLDDKIREGAEYLAKYSPEKIILACKREAGWKAASKFAEITGVRVFLKKYPAGILTNTNLENFTETDLVFICDPWIDKNALEDANRIGIDVLSICDTNNFTKGIDKIIPGNNKSTKSIGMIFYLLTKLYVEARGLKKDIPPIQEFVDGWDELQPPK
ncbi:hypothetical protein COU54_02680 [Candidatus Pacearchaeota archaeon CG10_big_fil_rev_8_21_14_0_10_31_24]|nr:MAG: hypothetical protein COU54_02680 [Candidatus Pacearchaeota archaeon CG10_big_fil_rev_8_21_14_0_10_31_24]